MARAKVQYLKMETLCQQNTWQGVSFIKSFVYNALERIVLYQCIKTQFHFFPFFGNFVVASGCYALVKCVQTKKIKIGIK